MSDKPVKQLNETDLVQLTRNAILVAGAEMGPDDGDHWPVIHATVDDVLKGWEKLEAERSLQKEMKRQLYAQLEEMEKALPSCSSDVYEELTAKVEQLRDIYDAYFEDVVLDDLVLEEMDMPLYVRRAEAVIRSLTAYEGELVLEDISVPLKVAEPGHELELIDETEA